MVMPETNVEMNIELIAPIAMEKGLRFAIAKAARTVGAGTVSEGSSRQKAERRMLNEKIRIS